MPISKKYINTRDHVFDAITKVLLRPRFGIDIVEVGEDWRPLRFRKDGFNYVMFVGSSKNVTYITVHTSDSDESPFFIAKWKGNAPNLRKLGVTLANKVKLKQFHFVSDS